MLVNEIMTVPAVTITTRTSTGEAWETLRALDVRHLPVVNEDRELVGIVSDRDFSVPPVPPLVAELLESPRPPMEAPVTAIMTGDPISVEPDDDLEDVVDLMIENKVGAVPVVDPEGHVAGIVSYLDILRSVRDVIP